MKKFNVKVRRVQKHIETLDMLKMPRPKEGSKLEERQNTRVEQIVKKQQPLKHSDSVVVTTKWETFD